MDTDMCLGGGSRSFRAYCQVWFRPNPALDGSPRWVGGVTHSQSIDPEQARLHHPTHLATTMSDTGVSTLVAGMFLTGCANSLL